ncbi:hypothetical protein BJY01DRAFT_205904 [Aspergillus pseudoustus]|uniref:GST N-terminal domain-containing protein n=1 Tax=Aspergillus pseudoustus TaxID=1810923 RepID=A0ABR4KPY2_9EURO
MPEEIILYDLASTKGVCFSPAVWRIRIILNFKHIPYSTIFLEFPDIESTLKPLVPPPVSEGKVKYTVPAIHHIPSNSYVMDSAQIALFLESTYPDPPVPLTSELGRTIEAQARGVIGATFGASVMPREMNILAPRAQEYFRRTREAYLGHKLEDLLADPEKEEQSWDAMSEGIRAVSELLRTNKADGPFVLGARPSYTDFFVAGSLQAARVVDEGVFLRIAVHDGFKEVYEACLPYMEKKD